MIDPAGKDVAAVLADLDARQAREPDVHGSRLFGLVYPTGRDDLEQLMLEAHRRYLFGNALNPFKFPELAALESDVVEHVGALLNVPSGGGGAMTSGGTESILMSMLVNRERAKERGIDHPTIVAPVSAHPAYAKAAHYFGLDVVRVPLDDHFRADVRAAADLVGPDTAVVIASAFSYPYGVMDPVADLAAIAAEHGAGCHVDACVGGFVLPFLERLGHAVPPWDFRVEGVTEISADIHKYGYVPKGASVVLHRDDDWFGHQAFVYDQWPSGLYGSAAMAGARPAAPIATAWAVLTHLGIDGYTEIMRGLMETVAKVRTAVDVMPDVAIVGEPIGPVLAFRSDTIDLYAVGDVMDAKGWNLNRNVDPPGLHLMLSPVHAEAVDALLADLADAVAHHGTSVDKEIRYS
ncbi:MAG TPA: aminotransferase class V-fold PLP-dependent enzyme [Acidimicrobiia bacterium]|nr:aminotransferase class V-fold PLP-dependent enzyme [Acidimicrobiia bacterium]